MRNTYRLYHSIVRSTRTSTQTTISTWQRRTSDSTITTACLSKRPTYPRIFGNLNLIKHVKRIIKPSHAIRFLSGMAWLSSGGTNEELVANMRKSGLIESDVVAKAMKKVDRANYVRVPRYAYEDAPQSIGHGATISAPHMHAHACQYLLPWIHRDAHILDVGSGSGYTAAVFYHLLQTGPVDSSIAGGTTPAASTPHGHGLVVGIDHIPALVSWSISNLQRDGLGSVVHDGTEISPENNIAPSTQEDGVVTTKTGNAGITMVAGDGRQGWEEGAPYDVIHVGAAAPVIPEALVRMLKSPGRMFIPVGPDGGDQDVWTVDKDVNGRVTKTRLFGVRYVPLTDQSKQMASR